MADSVSASLVSLGSGESEWRWEEREREGGAGACKAEAEQGVVYGISKPPVSLRVSVLRKLRPANEPEADGTRRERPSGSGSALVESVD